MTYRQLLFGLRRKNWKSPGIRNNIWTVSSQPISTSSRGPLSGLERKEDFLSAIIADLLNPSGSHGQQHKFLNAFLQIIKRPDLKDKKLPKVGPQVWTDHNCENPYGTDPTSLSRSRITLSGSLSKTNMGLVNNQSKYNVMSIISRTNTGPTGFAWSSSPRRERTQSV